MPVWHVSIAWLRGGQPARLELWTSKKLKLATRKAKRLLDGVGVGSGRRFRTEYGGSAVHVQKPLTAGEILQLPKAWMAIPAIDDLGPTIEF